MFGLSAIVGEISLIRDRAIAEQKYIDSLPDEEKKVYLAKREKERELELAHKRALEVAEAGRPRNFWGK